MGLETSSTGIEDYAVPFISSILAPNDEEVDITVAVAFSLVHRTRLGDEGTQAEKVCAVMHAPQTQLVGASRSRPRFVLPRVGWLEWMLSYLEYFDSRGEAQSHEDRALHSLSSISIKPGVSITSVEVIWPERRLTFVCHYD